MPCYRQGGCGPYEMNSCTECPASQPAYLEKYKNNTPTGGGPNVQPPVQTGQTPETNTTAEKAPAAPVEAVKTAPASFPLETPGPLSDAAQDVPVPLSKEAHSKCLKTVESLYSQTAYLHERLKQNNLRKSDIQTLLSLFRYGFNDLNEALAGGQFLDDALEQAKADLRAANSRIRKLEAETGQNLSGTQVRSGIMHMSGVINAWYELCGFRYAAETINHMGLSLEFSYETDSLTKQAAIRERLESIEQGDRAFARKAVHFINYLFDEDSEFDLYRDTYHNELLDTDKNRNLIQKLITGAFPNARVTGYDIRRDRSQYLLRPRVYIDFDDIYNLCRLIDNASYNIAARSAEDGPNRIAVIKDAVARAHETYGSNVRFRDAVVSLMKDIRELKPDFGATCIRLQKQGDLCALRDVIDLWHMLGDIPINPETETLRCRFNPCYSESFLPGIHREEIWYWFEETFGLRVGSNLMGV